MNIYEAKEKYRKKGDIRSWRDCVIEIYRESKDYDELSSLRSYLKSHISDAPDEYMSMIKDLYTLAARDRFDDYMIAMEWDRENKFYLPRRNCLVKMVEILQKLEDDEADIACISMPPGVGKSGLGIFFITHLGGRDPLNGILTSSHKNQFLQGAYQEVLREVSTPEYRWHDIFPERKVAVTDAKNLSIGIDKAQRFNTFQFASITAGLAGLARAKQLLYCDDLIEGTEEAFSIERLNTKWARYTVDLVQRKSGPCKELHIATRWSVHDIIGRLIEAHEGDKRFLVLNTPAPNDEETVSNFDFGPIRDSFPLEKYLEIKKAMDEFSYGALYMGRPVEREGLVYQRDSLRRYLDLPEGQPDAILGVCDTAEGGGDDTVLPVFAVYGSDHYLIDAVVSNALPEVTDSLCANILVKQGVQRCQFESNSAGGRTADKVRDLVKSMGGITSITKKKTTQNKETKIIVESDWVKEHILFPDDRLIDKGGMVNKLINKLCSYTHIGKNPHDDVPDAMAQYSQFYRSTIGLRAELVDRRYFGF